MASRWEHPAYRLSWPCPYSYAPSKEDNILAPWILSDGLLSMASLGTWGGQTSSTGHMGTRILRHGQSTGTAEGQRSRWASRDRIYISSPPVRAALRGSPPSFMT